MTKKIILISGDIAAGKDTLAAEMARHFNLELFAVGGFYRLVGKTWIDQHGTDRPPTDDEATQIAQGLLETPNLWSTMKDPGLGAEKYGSLASYLSTLPKFRGQAWACQRLFMETAKGCVLAGQDCGPYVDHAEAARIFVTASLDERALRRSRQLKVEPDAARQAIEKREQDDRARTIAPLKRPAGKHLALDTTNLTIGEVTSISLLYVKQLKIASMPTFPL